MVVFLQCLSNEVAIAKFIATLFQFFNIPILNNSYIATLFQSFNIPILNNSYIDITTALYKNTMNTSKFTLMHVYLYISCTVQYFQSEYIDIASYFS